MQRKFLEKTETVRQELPVLPKDTTYILSFIPLAEANSSLCIPDSILSDFVKNFALFSVYLLYG